MVVAERAEPLVLQLVDLGDGALVIAAAGIGPSGEQGGGYVALTPGAAFREAVARSSILVLFDGANTQREVGQAVAWIALQQSFREPERIGHVAIGQRGDKRPLDQLW